MATVLWTRKTYSGFGYWTLGAFIVTIATSIHYFINTQPPNSFNINISHFTIITGVAINILGLQIFRGLKPSYRLIIWLLLAFLIVVSYLDYFAFDLLAHTVITCLYISLFQAWALFILIRNRPAYFGSCDILLAANWIMTALFFLGRAIYTIINILPLEDVKADSQLEGITYLITILSDVLISTGKILLNSERLEYDYLQALKNLETDIEERQHAEKQLAESEALYRTLIENTTSGIFIQRNGKFLEVNKALLEVSGYSSDELIGMDVMDTVHPEHREMVAQIRSMRLDGKLSNTRYEVKILTKQGEVRWLNINSVEILYSGQPAILGTAFDVTERRRIEDNLNRSLKEIQRHDNQMVALNRMNELLLSCNNRNEAYSIITYSVKEMFTPFSGVIAVRKNDESTDLKIVASWGEGDYSCQNSQLSDCWATRQGTPFSSIEHGNSLECQFFPGRPNCSYFCLPMIVRGQTLGLIHVSNGTSYLDEQSFQEVKTLATAVGEAIKLALSNLQLHEALLEQAIRDPLTGMFNRRYLDVTLPRELRRNQRNNELMSVAMLDLDNFKKFNDLHGHEAGDTVLKNVGNLLLRFLRSSDIPCRYGGEEFTVVMPASSLIDAHQRLEHFRQNVEQLQVLHRDGQILKVTVSIGIAETKLGETNAIDLLDRADNALYQAKAQGRNQVVSWAQPANH